MLSKVLKERLILRKFTTEVIHIGSGQNQSVLDIISALEKVWNKKLDKKFVNMRPGEHKISINLNPTPLKKDIEL